MAIKVTKQSNLINLRKVDVVAFVKNENHVEKI